MFKVIYQQDGGQRQKFLSTNNACTIGRGRNNDLVLKHRRVARRHAVIEIDASGLTIHDMGSLSGTWVNKERIVSYGPIQAEDEIIIGNCVLRVNDERAETGAVQPMACDNSPMPQPADVIRVEPARVPSSRDANAGINATLLHWRQLIHGRIIEQMDLRRKDVHNMSDAQLRTETEALLNEILADLHTDIPAQVDRDTLRKDVLNEAIGLGPLEELLEDDSITEIMVNRSDQIFIERNGKLVLSASSFTSDHAVLAVIERIIIPVGRRIDESSPMVDARLKDGSRVNAIIAPLALKGPCLTIRKFSKRRLAFSDLIGFGSINEAMVAFLRVCVERRRNIIVSGGTGSGKTTLLNVLSNFIPDDERIITVEDAAELQLNQPDLVSLESRPPNLEGRGQITIRDLVRNALRMRPDRIVVGECRGGEALDMLQAMNTGHDGSLTTAHANSPRDVLSRLEVMVMMAGMELPVSAIREQLASAVDVIVQQNRFPDGSRRVTRITEVVGIESGTIQLQDIFRFTQHGVDAHGRIRGSFVATGFIPSFYEELAAIGVDVDHAIFNTNEAYH